MPHHCAEDEVAPPPTSSPLAAAPPPHGEPAAPELEPTYADAEEEGDDYFDEGGRCAPPCTVSIAHVNEELMDFVMDM